MPLWRATIRAMPKTDPSAAEDAFLSLKPRLDELPEDELTTVNLDVQKVASAIIAIGRKIRQPEIRSRFAGLPRDEFDIRNVDGLEAAGMAAFHATIELLRASVHGSEAKVPLSMVEHANQIKQRMLDLLDYHVGDDPVDGPEINSIRQGQGYTDLASDLLRLAELYNKHDELVRRDIKNYVTTDREQAGRLGHEILAVLGKNRDSTQRLWSLYVRRCLTLIRNMYGEVSAAGRWLYRRQDANSMFPSLYTILRRGPGNRTNTSNSSSAPRAPDTTRDMDIEVPETD